MTLPLVPIPIIDVREGGPVRHGALQREVALKLHEACLSFLPRPLRALAPAADRIARAWLERSASPYADEVARLSSSLGVAGFYAINVCYECGCTAQVKDGRLRRTLDWPFSGLGRHVQIAVQDGGAGSFYNVTWPGFVGVLTAMAPGRFAAALNQAPLHRRTRGGALRGVDHLRHGWTTWSRVRDIPPAHLLRRVFETAPDFATARRLLIETPVARPVLFTLSGVRPDQVCLIERTETEAVVHDGPVAVANDWRTPSPDWEPRAAAWISDKRADDAARRRRLETAGEGEDFSWLTPPILNADTRIAVEMDARAGRLAVLGLEKEEIQAKGEFAAVTPHAQ